MKLTITEAPKASRAGKLLIEGLAVSPTGDIEPVIVIRASEEGAYLAGIGYLDASRNKAYAPNFKEAMQEQVRRMQHWQRLNGTIAREVDEVKAALPVSPETVRSLGGAAPITSTDALFGKTDAEFQAAVEAEVKRRTELAQADKKPEAKPKTTKKK